MDLGLDFGCLASDLGSKKFGLGCRFRFGFWVIALRLGFQVWVWVGLVRFGFELWVAG